MSFAIHYRSTETMHPAKAYEIIQDARRLVRNYIWSSAEPLHLRQGSDGFLAGRCRAREDLSGWPQGSWPQDNGEISSNDPAAAEQQPTTFVGDPEVMPVSPNADCEQDLQMATVTSLTSLLCTISRQHGIDWEVGHDYEPNSIGKIVDGEAGAELIEQLEVFGSLGELLGRDLSEAGPAWAASEADSTEPKRGDDSDDEGPMLLKFPTDHQ